MRVSMKLTIGFGIILLIAIVVGILGITGMRELQESGIEMYDKQIRGLEYVYDAIYYFSKIRIESNKILISSLYDDSREAANSLQQYEIYINQFIYCMNKSREIAPTEEILEYNNKIFDLFINDYIPDLDGINKIVIDDIPNHDNHLYIYTLITTMKGTAEEIETLLTHLVALTTELANQTNINNSASMQTLVIVQLVLLVAAIISVAFLSFYIKRNMELSSKVHFDAVTGIYNRRYLDENMNHITKILSRSRSSLSILMIDIDFFKKYNDSYGHQAGDTCLKIIAEIISSSVTREDDFVARYGGEEFIVVLPYTGKAGACTTASKLIEKVLEQKIPHEKSEISPFVTVSIGITTVHVKHTQSYKEIINCADKALYVSKHTGRNKLTYLDLEDLDVPFI